MFWLFLSVVILTRSALGRAIATRIAGGRPVRRPDPHALDAAEQRLEEHLVELDERLEFAERLLQQQRRRQNLPPIA